MADMFAPADVSRIELCCADITKLVVDAIVNAANEALAGGGGVDGAIHRAAGHADLQAACRKLGGCATGDAKVTPAFKLRARYIFHAVGPVYGEGRGGEPELLASCYRRCMQLAIEHGCRSIAFPAISTGVYGYPFDDATRIALTTVARCLAEPRAAGIERALLVFFSPGQHERAEAIRRELIADA